MSAATFDLERSRERLAAFEEQRQRRDLPSPCTMLTWAPDRLIRREGFDAEALVAFLGNRRPSLRELEAERARRGMNGPRT